MRATHQHDLRPVPSDQAMRYRAPLLDGPDNTLGDHYKVITRAQLAKFADWSMATGKPVYELMQGLMVEESEDNHHTGAYHVVIEGILPHCGLYGVMLPDGSTHT